jgi:predicted outer membrane repeat protein
MDAGTLLAEDTTFLENESNLNGGAIRVDEGAGAVTARNCLFEANTAQHGGAMDFGGETLDLEEVAFVGNLAPAGVGGALYVENPDGTVDITCDACTFANNDAVVYAGAVDLREVASGSLLVTGSTFTANGDVAMGGAVRVDGGDGPWVASFTDTVFSDHYVTEEGAAVAVDGVVTVDLTFDGCTVTGNEARLAGGGVYLDPDADVTLTSIDTDWGEGDTDNSPGDVNDYSYGAAATFTCSAVACE